MPAQTQEERKAETRSRLVAAAADLFARKGFHAVSAEAVADAADRTTGALQPLRRQGRAAARARRAVAVRVGGASSPASRTRPISTDACALWSDSVAAQQADSELWLLLEFELWLHGARNAEFADRLAARYDDRRRNLAVPLQAWAKDEGLGKLRHPERTAGLVIALLLGAAMQQRLDPNAFSSADVVAGLRSLLEGDAA